MESIEEWTKQKWAEDLVNTPPPTHNPMIGTLHIDTLNNINQSLIAIRDLCLLPNVQAQSLEGIYYLICTIVDALEFETEYRLAMVNK